MSDAATQRGSLPWPLRPRRLNLPLAAFAVAALLFTLIAVQLETGFGGPAVGNVFANWLYDGVGVAAACACFARGLRAGERAAWLLIGLGVLAWTAGDIYWTVALQTVADPPFPSLADAGYLGLYLPAFVGLGLLIRVRVVRFTASVWLDGLGAGLTVCALAAGIVLNEVWQTSTGGFAAVATNMAYPAGDALLLGLVLAAFGFSGLAARPHVAVPGLRARSLRGGRQRLSGRHRARHLPVRDVRPRLAGRLRPDRGRGVRSANPSAQGPPGGPGLAGRPAWRPQPSASRWRSGITSTGSTRSP